LNITLLYIKHCILYKEIYFYIFLFEEDSIFSDSLYFETVRLATSIPSFFKISLILLSLKGFFLFSELIIFFIFSLIDFDEKSFPSSFLIELEKKNFSSNIP